MLSKVASFKPRTIKELKLRIKGEPAAILEEVMHQVIHSP
jgi:hypothetical protein